MKGSWEWSMASWDSSGSHGWAVEGSGKEKGRFTDRSEKTKRHHWRGTRAEGNNGVLELTGVWDSREVIWN